MQENNELQPQSQEIQESAPLKKGYFHISRTMTYSLIFVLPLLLMYEVLIALLNEASYHKVRNGADVILKNLLYIFGTRHINILFTLFLLLGLGVAFWIERKKYQFEIRKKYFGFMLGESVIYGLLLGVIVGNITRFIFQPWSWSLPMLQQGGHESFGLLTQLVLSLGAGIYEELLFRVILVSAFFWLLKIVAKKWKNWMKYTVAAIVAAFIFSAFHYIGVYGDRFTLASFTFRFVAGLVLNGLYITRGFGIAVWTHALYDIFISLAG
jgi:hypothetical protein